MEHAARTPSPRTRNATPEAAQAPVRFVAPGESLPGAGTAASSCSTCNMRHLCVPATLPEEDVVRLDALRFARRRLREGEALLRAGEKFEFIYAVRSGTFKSVLSTMDGREQVTGFQFSGDVLGMDGLATGAHASTAVALEDAQVCAIPYAQLAHLASGSLRVHQALSKLMSREIVREHGLMMLLGSMRAEERLASFLLNVSERMKARGYSGTEFHLRMSRAEIGSYLGMKLETVSRTLSAFQQQGLLEVDKKHIRIVDAQALGALYEVQVH